MKMKTMILSLAVAAGIGLFGARDAAAFHHSWGAAHVSIGFSDGPRYYGGYRDGYGGGYDRGYCPPAYSSYGPVGYGYTSYRPYRLVRVFVDYPYPHYELRRVYTRPHYRPYGY